MQELWQKDAEGLCSFVKTTEECIIDRIKNDSVDFFYDMTIFWTIVAIQIKKIAKKYKNVYNLQCFISRNISCCMGEFDDESL